MPALTCGGCGGLTNTACCDHDFNLTDPKAERCFAKMVDGKWIKGCAYETCSVFERQMADALINQVH